MTFLIALLALSLVAMVLSLRSVLQDDRGTTPPPRSHATGRRSPSAR